MVKTLGPSNHFTHSFGFTCCHRLSPPPPPFECFRDTIIYATYCLYKHFLLWVLHLHVSIRCLFMSEGAAAVHFTGLIDTERRLLKHKSLLKVSKRYIEHAYCGTNLQQTLSIRKKRQVITMIPQRALQRNHKLSSQRLLALIQLQCV